MYLANEACNFFGWEGGRRQSLLDFSTGALRVGWGSLGIHGNPVSRHLNLN